MKNISSVHEINFENLPTINRNLVVIEPTAAFLDWARRFPDPDPKLTLDELLEDNTAYLIPEQDGDSATWLKRNFKNIFDMELDSWCTDRALWPKVRSFKVFKEFFSVHFCSIVIDLGKGLIDREYI
jgi:hypothetical protein